MLDPELPRFGWTLNGLKQFKMSIIKDGTDEEPRYKMPWQQDGGWKLLLVSRSPQSTCPAFLSLRVSSLKWG